MSFLTQELNALITIISSIAKSENKKTAIPASSNSEDYSYYQKLSESLSESERLILILALAPHISSSYLEILSGYSNENHGIGGVLEGNGRSIFMPTVETAIHLLAHVEANHNPDFATKKLALFHSDSPLIANKIIEIENNGLPLLVSKISINSSALYQILWNKPYVPAFGNEFPAERISTKQNWEDLVLQEKTKKGLESVESWLKHHSKLEENEALSKRIYPGYRVIFHGPSGTGKTLAVGLLAKKYGIDAYRVDLSKIVSKYIGETEKNLKQVFDIAEQHNWILFFDEGDALFGKRTEAKTSNDRHSNQEIAYLLQRIERYPKMIIVATNLVKSMDDAFSRRFQSRVEFFNPDFHSSLKLYNTIFKDELGMDEEVDFISYANDHQLTGGNMMNILQKSALRAHEHNEGKLNKRNIADALFERLEQSSNRVDDRVRRELFYEFEKKNEGL